MTKIPRRRSWAGPGPVSKLCLAWGSGVVLISVNFGIQAIVKTEDCGRATSMYAFIRTLGMTIGVAVGGTVFQNLMTQKLANLSLPVEKRGGVYCSPGNNNCNRPNQNWDRQGLCA